MKHTHMIILSVLGLDLEQQLAGVGIAFYTLMREGCLLQGQRRGDIKVYLAYHEEINSPACGRGKMLWIDLAEIADTIAKHAYVAR